MRMAMDMLMERIRIKTRTSPIMGITMDGTTEILEMAIMETGMAIMATAILATQMIIAIPT